MPDGPPLNVVIAGAGRAGLEAMFRLHRLAGPRARITLLAANEAFSNHELDVLLPFATPYARRQNLRTLASAAGGRLHRARVSSIDVDEHHVITDAGETVAYDVLLLAIGAVQRAPLPHSLCFGSDGSQERMHGLIQDVEGDTCGGSRSSCPAARRAAGDVTSGPIKHGSLACRQADAAAEAIAAHAGVRGT